MNETSSGVNYANGYGNKKENGSDEWVRGGCAGR
jgi:hypothetical protein